MLLVAARLLVALAAQFQLLKQISVKPFSARCICAQNAVSFVCSFAERSPGKEELAVIFCGILLSVMFEEVCVLQLASTKMNVLWVMKCFGC